MEKSCWQREGFVSINAINSHYGGCGGPVLSHYSPKRHSEDSAVQVK